MNPILHSSRVALIRIGKMLPFLICFLVFVSYAESAFALATDDFLYYDDMLIPNKPISWLIGAYFEYNVQMLIVLFIISVAIETCVWNKLACVYLSVNLAEKSWFASHEYEVTIYIAVCVVNMVVSAWLCWKGVQMLK